MPLNYKGAIIGHSMVNNRAAQFRYNVNSFLKIYLNFFSGMVTVQLIYARILDKDILCAYNFFAGGLYMFCMNSNQIQGFAKRGYYFQQTGKKRLSSTLHLHDFYEFLFIVSGECLHERDGIEEKTSKGDLIFIAPGISHRFLSQSDNSDVIALSVVPEEVNLFFNMYALNDFPEKSFVLTLSILKYRVLLERCERLTYQNNEEYVLQLRMILNQIFLFATEHDYKRRAIPTEFSEVMEKMKTLEMASKGTSEFLRLSGYSHSQLCRLTRKYIGMTPTEYINSIRMGYAYDMIVYSNDDYQTICETVGFESFSYFCRLLKEHFGCSAAKLRKETEFMRKTL